MKSSSEREESYLVNFFLYFHRKSNYHSVINSTYNQFENANLLNPQSFSLGK